MEKLNRIKLALVERNKQQVWLAEQVGRSVNTINAWCNQRSQPDLKELKKIADALEIKDMRDLIDPG